METGRDERIRTRSLVREVNERVVVNSGARGEDLVELNCECGELGCFKTVTLARSEYEQRSLSGGYVLAPGHTTPAVEPSTA